MNRNLKKGKKKFFKSSFFLGVLFLILVISISIGTKIIKIDIDASSVSKNIPSNYSIYTQNNINTNKLEDKSVIFFSSYWCSRCNKISDKLKSIAQEHPKFKFYELNIEEYRDLANNLKISLTPSIVIKNNGISSTFEDVNINDLDKIPSKLL